MKHMDGISRLKNQLDSQSKNVNQSPLNLDFGVIQPGFMLKTNSFGCLIPPSSYSVCRSLTIGKTGEVFSGTVTIPEKIRSLKIGDNVLVVWVGEKQHATPLIVDIILPGTEVTK